LKIKEESSQEKRLKQKEEERSPRIADAGPLSKGAMEKGREIGHAKLFPPTFRTHRSRERTLREGAENVKLLQGVAIRTKED